MSQSDLDAARRLVVEFFGDESKAALWFETPNYMLGDVSPNWMIEFGRSERLVEFIRWSLSENEAP